MWLTHCLTLFLFYYGLLPPSKISQTRGSMCLSVHVSPKGPLQVCSRTCCYNLLWWEWQSWLASADLPVFSWAMTVDVLPSSPGSLSISLEILIGTLSSLFQDHYSPLDSISTVIEFPQGAHKQVGTASVGLRTTVRTSQLTWSYRGLCFAGHVL